MFVVFLFAPRNNCTLIPFLLTLMCFFSRLLAICFLYFNISIPILFLLTLRAPDAARVAAGLHAAKGRTNIELREQFILADGVSQSMAAFRPRTPRSNTNTPPSTGPIMKVSSYLAATIQILYFYNFIYSTGYI